MRVSTVSVFNGPGKNEVRLHTYDPRLAGATPTVFGKIVKSNAGSKYGQALQVDDAPDVAGDTGKITAFNADFKKSKVATARCKAKKFLWTARGDVRRRHQGDGHCRRSASARRRRQGRQLARALAFAECRRRAASGPPFSVRFGPLAG